MASKALIDTLIAEAGGEGEAGLIAAAWAIAQRAAARGQTMDEVIKSGFDGYTNPGSAAIRAQQNASLRAEVEDIVSGVVSGSIPNPVPRADHFLSGNVNPAWAKNMELVATIGGHRFYASGNVPEAAIGKATAPAAPKPMTKSTALASLTNGTAVDAINAAIGSNPVNTMAYAPQPGSLGDPGLVEVARKGLTTTALAKRTPPVVRREDGTLDYQAVAAWLDESKMWSDGPQNRGIPGGLGKRAIERARAASPASPAAPLADLVKAAVPQSTIDRGAPRVGQIGQGSNAPKPATPSFVLDSIRRTQTAADPVTQTTFQPKPAIPSLFTETARRLPTVDPGLQTAVNVQAAADAKKRTASPVTWANVERFADNPTAVAPDVPATRQPPVTAPQSTALTASDRVRLASAAPAAKPATPKPSTPARLPTLPPPTGDTTAVIATYPTVAPGIGKPPATRIVQSVDMSPKPAATPTITQAQRLAMMSTAGVKPPAKPAQGTPSVLDNYAYNLRATNAAPVQVAQPAGSITVKGTERLLSTPADAPALHGGLDPKLITMPTTPKPTIKRQPQRIEVAAPIATPKVVAPVLAQRANAVGTALDVKPFISGKPAPVPRDRPDFGMGGGEMPFQLDAKLLRRQPIGAKPSVLDTIGQNFMQNTLAGRLMGLLQNGLSGVKAPQFAGQAQPANAQIPAGLYHTDPVAFGTAAVASSNDNSSGNQLQAALARASGEGGRTRRY